MNAEKWASLDSARDNSTMKAIKHLDGPFWALVVTGLLTTACAALIGTAVAAL